MLSLFKKKPYLRDLIPNGHIDIHSHLLPGIDDGSQSFEDSNFLITELQSIGFEQFITTPHVMKNVWENTRAGITDTLKTLNDNLVCPVPLRTAAEYLMDANFVELFHSEPLLVLKDNYVLVEMSYLNPPIQLLSIIFELQVSGYKPVLAHPERYTFYHYNFDEYQKLKNAGCIFQLNLLSTIGYYGLDVAKVAEKLLQKGMIDFVGSDVHHNNHISGFSRKVVLGDVLPLKEAIARNQFFRF